MVPSRQNGSDLAGLAAAEAWFTEQGLAVPYVPASMRSDFRKLSPRIFGTGGDAPSLYDFAPYGEEFGTGRPADYVLVGVDGYGINSWFVHYYAVVGCVGVFAQRLWGGEYTPADSAGPDVTRAFAAAGRLVREAEAAMADGRVSEPERLLVVDSDRMGTSWIALPAPVANLEALGGSPLWRQTPEPVDEALAFLQSRRTG